jgi:2-polyprenyl-3-methyl-5-hydroxy-6-metoxy-1,4-benzoquinol methylase
MDAEGYSRSVDMSLPDESQAMALRLIGHNQRVLELGCAAGHVTRALASRGCSVVGLEIDSGAAEQAARHAEEVLVVDLDADDFATKLEGRVFDVALFGDVLEHLRDPLRALRSVRQLLAPATGFVVVSVPNVAHIDVKLALLKGRFDYGGWGLLDETHLRFFTRTSIERLLEEAGFAPVELERVIRPVFASEIGVDRSEIDPGTLDTALADPEAETYQFVIKAVPVDGAHAVAQLGRRMLELEDLLRARTIDHAVEIAHAERRAEQAEQAAADSEHRASTASAELDAMRQTRLFRWSAPARRVYRALRRGLPTTE